MPTTPCQVQAHHRPTFYRNGRVPALIDHGNNDKIVWESGAILYYLAEKYDTSGQYLGKNVDEKTDVLQWLSFQVSSLSKKQFAKLCIPIFPLITNAFLRRYQAWGQCKDKSIISGISIL